MDYEKLLKQGRKRPFYTDEDLATRSGYRRLDYGREQIERIIPHRDPFLLVDRLEGVDLSPGEEFIVGSRHINADDPVLRGHFPDYPIYPGSLQLEMSGQLGLCLTFFFLKQDTQLDADTVPVQVRATRVLGALFLEPVPPGNTVTLIAKKLEYDGYFGTVLAQVIIDNKVSCISISEVIFLD